MRNLIGDKMIDKKKISAQIEMISDNAMKRGYVRINFKDKIMNFYLRKQGIVRRVRIDMEKEKFIDVDNKCNINIYNCGYLLATKKLYMKKGIPTYWKKADKECTCKTRYVIYVSLLEDFFNPKEWVVIKQCERKENGIWKIVPHDVPISNIDVSNEKKKNTIKQMYSVYGVPVKVLAELFKLKERRIQYIVKDLKEQYKNVKKSKGLKKPINH